MSARSHSSWLAALACASQLAGCGGDSEVLVKVQPAGDLAELADVVQLRARFSNGGAVDEQSFPPAATSKQPITFPTSFAVTLPRSRKGRLEIALDGLDAMGLPVANGTGTAELRGGGTTTTVIALSRGAATCGNGQVDPGEECDFRDPLSQFRCGLGCRKETVADAGIPDGAAADRPGADAAPRSEVSPRETSGLDGQPPSDAPAAARDGPAGSVPDGPPAADRPAPDLGEAARPNGSPCTAPTQCASGMCVGAPPRCCGAATEVCNGKDDNCDGMVDEGACPVPVLVWQGRTYLFSSERLSWPAARDHCTRLGYHLVTIESVAENAWLTSITGMASGVSAWWIGLNDRTTEGAWVWENGSPAAYRNWNTNEPNQCVAAMPGPACLRENCGWMWSAGAATGKWNDGICELADGTAYAPMPFICEARGGPTL